MTSTIIFAVEIYAPIKTWCPQIVRRAKTSIFLDTQNSKKIIDVKYMLQGILKRDPEDMRLYRSLSILANLDIF